MKYDLKLVDKRNNIEIPIFTQNSEGKLELLFAYPLDRTTGLPANVPLDQRAEYNRRIKKIIDHLNKL